MTDDPQTPASELADHARRRWDAATGALLADPPPTPAIDEAALFEGVAAQLGSPARKVVRISPRTWAVVGVLAAAAIAVLWLRPRSSALPRYEPRFEAGIREVRGEPVPAASVPTVLPSSRLRWSFAPSTTSSIDVGMRIVVAGDARACIDPGAHLRRADSGALEIQGSIDELFALPPGRYELVAVLAPAHAWAGRRDPCGGDRPDDAIEVDRRVLEVRATNER